MAGRYKPYPEYKDSGVGWFGKVPVSWTSTRLKFETKINMGQSPNSEDCNQDGNGLPFLQGNAEFGVRHPSPKQYCEIPRKTAHEGQLLFSVRAPVGALNVADQTYGIGRGLCAIDSCKDIFHGFLWWLAPVIKSELDSVSTGSTFEAVSAEQVGDVIFFKPVIFDQVKIASFLDHETTKIDTLIEKQQQLIQLLKEKRQAVISHAVTKGLSLLKGGPSVKLRDSGVEWLGEIPEHWMVVNVRNLIRASVLEIQDGNHGELHPVAAEYVDDGIPFLMANNIKDGVVSLGESKCISMDRAEKLRIGFSQSGDLLLTHKGTVGEVALVPELVDIPYWMLTPQVTYYRWKANGYFKNFFYMFFRSQYFQIQLEIIGGKQSTRAYVGLIAQGDLVLAVPPYDEQIEIFSYLESAVGDYEYLISKAESAINFSEERRTALISAAVTGKIDVRDWVAPPASQTNKEVAA